MSAADSVQSSIETMHGLGDQARRRRAATAQALTKVRERNQEATALALAQARRPNARPPQPTPVRTDVNTELSFYAEDEPAPPAPPISAGLDQDALRDGGEEEVDYSEQSWLR